MSPRVIIIGTGWYGIAAARTYLALNPSVSLTLLEADNCIGGTWSASRVYPGLVADSCTGTFEFSDMTWEEEYGIPKWSDITGDQVVEYLDRYCKKHGILERCRFNTEATKVERQGKGWRVWVRETGKTGPAQEALDCDKLIVATGLTSKPNMPDVDTSKFAGRVMHSKSLGKEHKFLASETVKNVTVVGGCKSALEIVRLCAMAGKNVHWLIRLEGSGPAQMLDVRSENGTPVAKVAFMKITSQFQPSMLAEKGWWYWFLWSGKVKLGTWLVMWIFKSQSKKITGDRYDKSENGALLKPQIDNLFWLSSGSALHDTEKGFMKLVDEGKLIHVVRAAIESVEGSNVRLSDGRTISSDAIAFATGWKSSCESLFPDSMAAELGLLYPKEQQSAEQTSYWKSLDEAADNLVLDTYPVYKNPPEGISPAERDSIPFRLFRAIAPTELCAAHDRSIIFLGMLVNTLVPTHAEFSALWGVAYLEGLLRDGSCDGVLGDKKGMDENVAVLNAMMAHKYPQEKELPTAILEIQDFIARMLRDLGLQVRKRGKGEKEGRDLFGWKAVKREWFEPGGVEDYKGLLDEYLSKVKKVGGE